MAVCMTEFFCSFDDKQIIIGHSLEQVCAYEIGGIQIASPTPKKKIMQKKSIILSKTWHCNIINIIIKAPQDSNIRVTVRQLVIKTIFVPVR